MRSDTSKVLFPCNTVDTWYDVCGNLSPCFMRFQSVLAQLVHPALWTIEVHFIDLQCT